jgi:hypothetical protein
MALMIEALDTLRNRVAGDFDPGNRSVQIEPQIARMLLVLSAASGESGSILAN